MSRPDPRPDRPPIEVRIRDLDKIRERTPLRVEPRQFVGLGFLAVVALAAAFAGGYLLGAGAMHDRPERLPAADPVGVPAPTPAPGPAMPDADAPEVTEDAGVDPAAGTAPDVVAPSISGSVSPVPAPEPMDATEPAPDAGPPEPGAVPAAMPAPAAEPAVATVDETTQGTAAAPTPAAEPAAAPPPAPAPEVDVRGPEEMPDAAPRRDGAPHVQAVGLRPPWPAVLRTDAACGCSRLDPTFDCAPETAEALPVASAPPEAAPAPSPEDAPAPEPPAAAPTPRAGKPDRKPDAAPSPTSTPASAPSVKKTASSTARTGTTSPGTDRHYGIQVRAYQDRQAAREFRASLVAKGYKARIVTYDDPQGNRWFRIRIGRYNRLSEAQAFARRFNKRHQEEAVAVEVP